MSASCVNASVTIDASLLFNISPTTYLVTLSLSLHDHITFAATSDTSKAKSIALSRINTNLALSAIAA